MSITKHLRAQHDELLKIAGELGGLFEPEKLKADASTARSTLSRLAGKLTVHLSMEDKNMYPTLLGHSDEEIRDQAKRFIQEMGGIGIAFRQYLDKWPTAQYIEQDPDSFIAETKDIFKALGTRIEKENTKLYPVVDELGI